MLVRDVSVVDAANLVGCGVGVEGVGIDDIDGDYDDNEIDVENGDFDEVVFWFTHTFSLISP